MSERVSIPAQIGGYVILGKLGEGGAGVVLKAFDPSLERIVAVKVLVDSSETMEARFEREAKTAAQLDHPNIARVHTFGTDDAGNQYIVMEFVDGRTLEEIVGEKGPLPPERALRLLRNVAAGLGAAAKLGLVHRDIKPGNIMVDSNDVVKIVDFGLARKWQQTDSNITGSHQVIGTPDFLSPEQAQNLTMDFRSDMYSLGGTLFYAMTGRPPFVNRDSISTIVDHIRRPFPELREFCPGASDQVCALTERLCRKTPDERYASYAEVLAAIDEILVENLASDNPSRPIKRRKQPASADTLRTRVLALLLLLALAVLAYSNRTVFWPRPQDRAPDLLISPAVGGMDDWSLEGIPSGWDFEGQGAMIELQREGSGPQAISFGRITLGEGGAASLVHTFRPPMELQGRELLLNFRCRLTMQAKVRARILEQPGERFTSEARITGSDDAEPKWIVPSLSTNPTGGAGLQDLQVSFEFEGKPGATIDLDNVRLMSSTANFD